MSSMSASDAAPLPRLGEVFFDVRGSSRSMRLSWYADTGVSVFSIWQGGTCTGTFRLPMEELPRLIDALQRGAQANDPRGFGGYASQLPGAPTPRQLHNRQRVATRFGDQPVADAIIECVGDDGRQESARVVILQPSERQFRQITQLALVGRLANGEHERD